MRCHIESTHKNWNAGYCVEKKVKQIQEEEKKVNASSVLDCSLANSTNSLESLELLMTVLLESACIDIQFFEASY